MSLADVVHRFKSLTTNLYIKGIYQSGWPRFNKHLWQPQPEKSLNHLGCLRLWLRLRNYYDHINCNEQSLHQIPEYIINNPLKWELDEYYR